YLNLLLFPTRRSSDLITTFHQEMIPTDLLFSLIAQRERIPFPAVIEVLLMEIAFEILREASLRMPKAVGSAISIVGTLVIGQARSEEHTSELQSRFDI